MIRRATFIFGLFVLALGTTGCITAFAAFQPKNIGAPVIVLTTVGEDGTPKERVLSPIENGGQLFVSANHWPRAWYHRALANPSVRVTSDGRTAEYLAVPVSEDERQRLLEESGFPFIATVFTGFAPREFLRLDPQ